MQNRWETEISQREVPRKTFNERLHDRWGLSHDEQISSFDSNRLAAQSGKRTLF